MNAFRKHFGVKIEPGLAVIVVTFLFMLLFYHIRVPLSTKKRSNASINRLVTCLLCEHIRCYGLAAGSECEVHLVVCTFAWRQGDYTPVFLFLEG